MRSCANWRRICATSKSVFQEVPPVTSETLSKIDDPYLRERALDIQDVTRRVIRNLQGKAPKAVSRPSNEPHILVAHNITPSDTATMNREQVLGLATDLGSRTSHTAIMARSLGIPAIVGLHDVTEKLETGAGSAARRVQRPAHSSIRRAETLCALRRDRIARKDASRTQLTELRETKSTTRDGRHIVLSANIELPNDVEAVAANGAEGIGLYRTEFLYLNRATLPSEEEQFEIYRTVAEQVAPASADHPDLRSRRRQDRRRRSDVGDEQNPFLGWRAIRFCLENLDIFKTQLRAILRASAAANVKMHVPHDLRAGRIAARARRPGRMQERAEARRPSPSATRLEVGRDDRDSERGASAPTRSRAKSIFSASARTT